MLLTQSLPAAHALTKQGALLLTYWRFSPKTLRLLAALTPRPESQWRRGVEGFLGDLLQAQSSKDAQGWVYRPMRAGRFSGEEVGYKAFKYITERLIALKLVEVKPGWQKWDRNVFDLESGGNAGPSLTNHSYATRFRATEELLRASEVVPVV